MVVRLDLLICKQTESSCRCSRLRCAVFAAAAAYILTSALVFSKGLPRSCGLNGEIELLLSRAEKDAAKTALIDAELKRIEARNQDVSEKLDFVLSAAPVIEFLCDLSGHAPESLVIESLSMSDTSAVLKGSALADEDVLELAEALPSSVCVASVSLPVINGGIRHGIPLREFSMELKLAPLREILTKEKQAAAGGVPIQNEAD
ncbi:MAG: hypothetical protein K6E42_04300 [Synergistes sp.]|nr:hypothetical protein [Synergistes sp.]